MYEKTNLLSKGGKTTPSGIACLRYLLGTLRRQPSELRYAIVWLRSILSHDQEKWSALNLRIPWVSFKMIYELKRLLRKNCVVFEYGSGGSTLFFIDRVKYLVSIEHDENYYKKVRSKLLLSDNCNCHYIIAKPEIGIGSGDCLSNIKYYSKVNFDKYVRTINKFDENFFDLIFVDGRARVAAVYSAAKKLKYDGFLILDNSDRPYYRVAVEYLARKGWKRRDVSGLTLRDFAQPQTSIFTKTLP